MLVNCSVDTSDNATLSFAGAGRRSHIVHADKKKIKMEATNVFNITNLIFDDAGKYTCKVCNKEKAIRLYVNTGKMLSTILHGYLL
jgi:hypothetical protein